MSDIFHSGLVGGGKQERGGGDARGQCLKSPLYLSPLSNHNPHPSSAFPLRYYCIHTLERWRMSKTLKSLKVSIAK